MRETTTFGHIEPENMPPVRMVTTERQGEQGVTQHIAWMRSYVSLMSEDNWRDMKLRLERQLDALSALLRKE